jgi:hypothetical protein
MMAGATLIVACGGSPLGKATGSEGGPCYGNATCDVGLSCYSKTCVQVTGADAGAGRGGEGGTSSAGKGGGGAVAGAGGVAAAGVGGGNVGGSGGAATAGAGGASTAGAGGGTAGGAGGGAAAGAGGATAGSGGVAGLPLPAVASEHLQLWLTADKGVDCVSGEVTIWSDQSGKHRDAVKGAHKGPQCPATLHALAGANLPYFSAPGTAPPFNDETLDIGLAFLAGTDYTIFVVERRWADRTPASQQNEELIGTDLPTDINPTCPSAGDQIDLGYAYYDGFPTLGYESVCYQPYTGTRGRVPDAAGLPPSPTAVDMLRLAQNVGASPTVWQNGVQVNGGAASGGPGSGFVGGSIGRAFGVDADNRFQGDIAEVVIFDAGLADADVQQMLAYFKAHWHL